MIDFKRTFVRLIVILFCLIAGRGVAQSPEEPVSFWKFPQLAGSKPFLRWWWMFEQRAYPLGDIPEGAYVRALEETRQFDAFFALASKSAQADRWQNIGPAPILGGQIGATGFTRPMSGRVIAIAVDPTDPDRWLIGAATGGIWETRDAGNRWTPLTEDQASLAIGAIAFAPGNPTIIYAGTGAGVLSGASLAGVGLLKSTDRGRTWNLLAASVFARSSFTDIKVNPADPDIVLAATVRGFAGRSRQNVSAPPPRGIFKSVNGGVSWIQTLNGEATGLEVDPTNFSNQYAGLGYNFGSPLNGVYRSTDGGETWKFMTGPWNNLPGGVGRVEMALAPSDPNVLYVGIQDATNNVGTDSGLLGLWRTDNAWATDPTWIQIPVESTDDGTGRYGYCGYDLAFKSVSRQCWFNHELSVDPTNPNILYAGGIPLWKFDGSGWTEVSKTASNPLNGIHVDQHAMAWAGNRLIVGNDGGVWSTTDGGDTWAAHNTNLAITQFYDGSIHPTNNNFAIAGSQDNGTEAWFGNDAWLWILSGDGADNHISLNNPNTHWLVSAQYLSLRRTTNGGASYVSASPPESGSSSPAPFISRFEQCPSNEDIVIAGTDNLWKSTDFFSAFRPSWSANSADTGSITAIAFAASDSTCQTYAFGTLTGRLRLTTDGGTSWVDIDPQNTVPNRAITDLAFDPSDANILYLTLSGFDEGTPDQPGHLFRTTDALSAAPTWSNTSPPVNVPNNTIVVVATAPHVLYVGTDLGIWKSDDSGSRWIHLGPETGMPNAPVFEMQINTRGRLIAFTHGRGAFVNDFPAQAYGPGQSSRKR